MCRDVALLPRLVQVSAVRGVRRQLLHVLVGEPRRPEEADLSRSSYVSHELSKHRVAAAALLRRSRVAIRHVVEKSAHLAGELVLVIDSQREGQHQLVVEGPAFFKVRDPLAVPVGGRLDGTAGVEQIGGGAGADSRATIVDFHVAELVGDVHLLDVVGLDRERSLSSILDAVVVEQFHLEPPAIREPRLDLPEAAVQLGLGVEALEGDLATDEFVRGCIGHDGVQAAAL